jgi:hypothetical protein
LKRGIRLRYTISRDLYQMTMLACSVREPDPLFGVVGDWLTALGARMAGAQWKTHSRSEHHQQ